MHTPFILYRYLSREFMRWFCIVIGGISALILIFDLVELLRRTAAKNIHFSTILVMVLLKLPHMILQIMPFIILIATLIVFWRFMKARELVVMRMAGLSVWQILAPLLVIASLFKCVELVIINPLTTIMYSQFEKLETRKIHGKEDNISLTDNGLWVRQTDRFGQFILRAARVDNQKLYEVAIFEFSDAGVFLRRLEASTAEFQPHLLSLEGVTVFYDSGELQRFSKYTFESDLSYEQIQQHSAAPGSISFWRLPEFIKFLEKSKLSTQKYRLQWHSLIANIFLSLSMILLGASSIFFQTGRSKILPSLILSIGLGFAMFFISDVTRALGLAATIPVIVAAWTPALIAILVGVTMMLHSDEGI